MGRVDPLDIKTWTITTHRGLKTYTAPDGRYWVEQALNQPSQWAKLARKGYSIAWEFDSRGGDRTGRVLIEGKIYEQEEAADTLFRSAV